MFRAPSRAQAGGRCRPPSPPAQPLAFPSAHKRPPYRSSPPIGRRVRHVAPVVQLGGRARVSALPIVIGGPRGTSRKLSGVETAETAAAPGQPLDPTGLRLSASGPSAASIDNDTRQQQHAAALSRSSVAVGLREAASVTRLCWEVALLWLLGVVVVVGAADPGPRLASAASAARRTTRDARLGRWLNETAFRDPATVLRGEN
ncbi:unnamed protein product [Lampetra fluviatilis]